MIIKFSRKSLREQISKMLKESEDGVMVDDSPMPGIPNEGPQDMSGLKATAAQACVALGELIKQCSTVGADSSDYEDMIDQINADFELPDQKAEVQG